MSGFYETPFSIFLNAFLLYYVKMADVNKMTREDTKENPTKSAIKSYENP